MPDAVIVSVVRTPFGRAHKGRLKDIRADDLAAVAVRGALERVGEPSAVWREDREGLARRAPRRAGAAQDAGVFREIVPVRLRDGTVVERDEGPRRDTSAEQLAALQPAFIAGGRVTAGNSS